MDNTFIPKGMELVGKAVDADNAQDFETVRACNVCVSLMIWWAL